MESHRTGTVSAQDLKDILIRLVEALQDPDAFTNEAVSLDAHGKPCSVFAPEAVQHDLLGWIIRLSYEQWPHLPSRERIGLEVSEHIDAHIRHVSDDEYWLMSLGDMGRGFARRFLSQAIARLDDTYLPPAIGYAKDPEGNRLKNERREWALAKAAKKNAPKT